MWQPDGWGFRARLGILVPHAAIGTESELHAMAPDGVSIHATRVPLGAMRAGGLMDPMIALEPVRAFADPPLVDDAVELLAAAPLHAISSVAAVLGLRALGVRRIALLDPPWFSAELTSLGVDYFTGQGLTVIHAASAGVP